jgi:hypothetical protein
MLEAFPKELTIFPHYKINPDYVLLVCLLA